MSTMNNTQLTTATNSDRANYSLDHLVQQLEFDTPPLAAASEVFHEQLQPLLRAIQLLKHNDVTTARQLTEAEVAAVEDHVNQMHADHDSEILQSGWVFLPVDEQILYWFCGDESFEFDTFKLVHLIKTNWK